MWGEELKEQSSAPVPDCCPTVTNYSDYGTLLLVAKRKEIKYGILELLSWNADVLFDLAEVMPKNIVLKSFRCGSCISVNNLWHLILLLAPSVPFLYAPRPTSPTRLTKKSFRFPVKFSKKVVVVNMNLILILWSSFALSYHHRIILYNSIKSSMSKTVKGFFSAAACFFLCSFIDRGMIIVKIELI